MNETPTDDDQAGAGNTGDRRPTDRGASRKPARRPRGPREFAAAAAAVALTLAAFVAAIAVNLDSSSPATDPGAGKLTVLDVADRTQSTPPATDTGVPATATDPAAGGTDPYGTDPYGADPYGTDPYGAGTNDPNGGTGQDVYGSKKHDDDKHDLKKHDDDKHDDKKHHDGAHDDD